MEQPGDLFARNWLDDEYARSERLGIRAYRLAPQRTGIGDYPRPGEYHERGSDKSFLPVERAAIVARASRPCVSAIQQTLKETAALTVATSKPNGTPTPLPRGLPQLSFASGGIGFN